MRNLLRSLLLAGAALNLAALPLAATIPAVQAQEMLPAPYVSRAFDAVLMPIDDSVRGTFGFDGSVTGVLVIAVAPGGVADEYGVEPGDVISVINGEAVTSPIALDEIVYYFLLQDIFDFSFDYYRDGAVATSDVVITFELYEEVVDVTTVSSWESWSYESFSYEEYTVEYSEEIVETYEESETIIEEEVTSEEFTEEMTEEETSEEEFSEEEEVTEEEFSEEEVTEDDGVEEEDFVDDEGSADEGDDGGDDGGDEE
jgi:hypothetical protein